MQEFVRTRAAAQYTTCKGVDCTHIGQSQQVTAMKSISSFQTEIFFFFCRIEKS